VKWNEKKNIYMMPGCDTHYCLRIVMYKIINYINQLLVG